MVVLTRDEGPSASAEPYGEPVCVRAPGQGPNLRSRVPRLADALDRISRHENLRTNLSQVGFDDDASVDQAAPDEPADVR